MHKVIYCNVLCAIEELNYYYHHHHHHHHHLRISKFNTIFMVNLWFFAFSGPCSITGFINLRLCVETLGYFSTVPKPLGVPQLMTNAWYFGKEYISCHETMQLFRAFLFLKYAKRKEMLSSVITFRGFPRNS